MLPIRDTIRSRTFPIVNLLIILANGFVFFIELTLPDSMTENFMMTFGLVPATLSLTNPLSWIQLFTHMFLHGGWFHFLSNMWILFIFGDNVDRPPGFGALSGVLYHGWSCSRTGAGFLLTQQQRPIHRCQRRDRSSDGRLFFPFPESTRDHTHPDHYHPLVCRDTGHPISGFLVRLTAFLRLPFQSHPCRARTWAGWPGSHISAGLFLVCCSSICS